MAARMIILGWIWTALAGLAGAYCLYHPDAVLAGVTLLFSALSLCPLTVPILKKQGIKQGGRIGLAVIFAGIAGFSIVQSPGGFKALLPDMSPPPIQPKTLAEMTGDFGNLKSKLFTTQGKNWDLQWSFDCASLGDSGNFNAKVIRQDGGVAAAIDRIGDHDSGTAHYTQGGSFYVQVVSECKWAVRVSG